MLFHYNSGSLLRYTFIAYLYTYKNRAALVCDFLITQSTIKMVLSLLASWVGFRRECLVVCGEVGFAEMVNRSAAVRQFV